jgi:outer membrane protein assembly factor BamB
LPDGRLISAIDLHTGEKPLLGMFSLDTTIEWTFELPVEKRGCNFIQVSDNDLLVGVFERLERIDLSGKLVWYEESDDNWFKPLGVLMDGNYLVCKSKKQPAVMCVYDTDGNLKWSHEFQISGYIDPSIVIYQDGNILFGHKTGISLISPDGELIWNLALVSDDSGNILNWNIFPAPDGRIVAACTILSPDNNVVKIFSLGKVE